MPRIREVVIKKSLQVTNKGADRRAYLPRKSYCGPFKENPPPFRGPLSTGCYLFVS
jgi:hypothetical protein